VNKTVFKYIPGILAASAFFAQAHASSHLPPEILAQEHTLSRLMSHDIFVPDLTSKPPNERSNTDIASWYGNDFKGKPTADGEKFDPQAMTCAHRTLPMQSMIKLTNTETGNTAVCRVNDRGPYVYQFDKHGRKILDRHGQPVLNNNRSVDCAERVGKAIGIAKTGVAHVNIQVLRLGPPSKEIILARRDN
jgi:hypothetical protein